MKTTTEMVTGPQLLPAAFLTSGSKTSPSSDESSSPIFHSDEAGLESSTGSLISKTTISPPQTIPEGRIVHASTSPIMSPTEFISPLSRDSSTRSLRTYNRSRPTRIPNDGSRRSSRRSTSANPSVSPAFAYLSSWSRDGSGSEQAAEPKPDDEGQAIGLNNEYIIGRKINQGGFGVVKEVHTLNEAGENLIRAVKIVRKSIPGKDELENEKAQQELEHEVSIWRHLKHRHILELHAVYDTDFATFCVMDLNIGGTLFDIVRRSRGSATENDGRRGLDPRLAKSYAYQLASALRYLHEDIRVCHRDVKLENCLVDMTVPNAGLDGGFLRLCDFGLADFLHSEGNIDYLMMEEFGSPASISSGPNRTTSSIIGTLEYASPKGLSVHRKLYETQGDVWAFGVVVYVLCTGELPFKHAMPSKTVDMIMRVHWDESALLHGAAGGSEVLELVQGCFEKDNELRLTMSEVLRSRWLEGCREAAEEEPNNVWQ